MKIHWDGEECWPTFDELNEMSKNEQIAFLTDAIGVLKDTLDNVDGEWNLYRTTDFVDYIEE